MSDGPPKRSASKPILIGCGVVLLLLVLCGGAAAWLGARGVHWFQAEVKKAVEDEEFAQKWRPPAAETPAETFSPETVAGYSVTAADENADFPALGIEREGLHAVYEKGPDKVDVSVYRADEAETSAVFDEVVRRIEDEGRFKVKTHVRLPRTLDFSVSDPTDLNGRFWHADGWLVFARSATVRDLAPFLKAYLSAIEGDGSGDAAETTPESADGPDAPPEGDGSEVEGDVE